MIDRAIDQIMPEDLVRLATNGVQEGRTIEYKQQLPGNADGDRKEFLADVSSFANAGGRDIVYGIRERREGGRGTGVPEGIVGVAANNLDVELLRFESILRDGLAPRVPGVRFRWIPGFELGPALIIRIPQSWSGPHMVTYSSTHGSTPGIPPVNMRWTCTNSGTRS